jgi:hypothetical protein
MRVERHLIRTKRAAGIERAHCYCEIDSAVILTGGPRLGEVAAAGIMIGVALLVLGTTGWIGRRRSPIAGSRAQGLWQTDVGVAADRNPYRLGSPLIPQGRTRVSSHIPYKDVSERKISVARFSDRIPVARPNEPPKGRTDRACNDKLM